MSSSQQPGPPEVRRRRRHSRPKGWKAIPKAVKVLLAVCIGVLILVPVALRNGWIGRKHVEIPAVTNSGPSGLMIAEASVDSASRTIKGVVRNTSRTAYRDVQVSYYIRDAAGLEAGTILGIVPSLGPNESAPFQTDPMPTNGREFVLREVVGTPR